MRFGEVVAAWLDLLEHEKRVKPSTLVDYRGMLAWPKGRERRAGERIMRAFGDCRLAEITTADVRRFLLGMDREGASARLVNKYRQVLHAVFVYAMRSDTFGLRENPAAETSRRPEDGTKPIETFEPDEVEAIVAAARAGLHRGRSDHNYSAETTAEWRRINERDAAML